MPIPRTASWNSLLAAAALAALPAMAREDSPPEPLTLLDAALAAPSTPYQGRVMVTQWYGKQTRAEELRVFVLPPDNVRREFLDPEGAVVRVSISDGETEVVRLVRAGKTVVGDAVNSYEKVLPFERERETLLSNYEISAGTGEKVAGRTTWRLTLQPKTPGKAWQSLWIDRGTNIVLRSKRYLPRRSFASQAQFVSFEPGKPQDPALFEVEGSTAGAIAARNLAPDFLTLDQLNKTTGEQARLPDRLPGGFVFESADVFPVGKSQVRHARYTDGLTVISLFQTDRPVRLPKGGVIPSGSSRFPGPLRASRAGKLLQWRAGLRYYVLMGDVPREILADVVKSLR